MINLKYTIYYLIPAFLSPPLGGLGGKTIQRGWGVKLFRGVGG